MSKYPPGSPAWWGETALIMLLGLWVAAALWPDRDQNTRAAAGPAAQTDRPQFRTMADLVEAGCLTASDLRAMREGRRPALTVCRDMARSR